MRITDVRAGVYQWTGPVVSPHPNFCTTAADMVARDTVGIGAFSFLGWLLVEIETDAGIVGICNAALFASSHQGGDRQSPEADSHGRKRFRHRLAVGAHVPPDHAVRA